MLTAAQREEIRLARSEASREKLARSLLGAVTELRCSRCDEAVEPEDLSPGRYWCRPCENARKRTIYKANRAAA